MDQLTSSIINKALSRRGFLASAGAVTAATLTGCGSDKTVTVPTATTPAATALTDVDVLNFALNLEYLEAEFYFVPSPAQAFQRRISFPARVPLP